MDRTAIDRRTAIADSAIDIVAEQGIRALTHRAVDARLDLPAGSASYYFRTKRALLEAVVDRLTEVSRRNFETSDLPRINSHDPAVLGREIAGWLNELLTSRGNHLAAHYALALELRGDPALHARVAASMFSRPHATELFEALGVPDAATAGTNFVSLVAGLVFDRFAGAQQNGVDLLAAALTTYIRGAMR